MEFRRVKRATGAIDEAFDAIFFAFWNMAGEAVKLLGPMRMLTGLFKIEAAGAECPAQFNIGEIRLDDLGIRIQWADQLTDYVAVCR